ncbi:hypothetical protein TNIN_167811 [Trichonephila inaurata madagascariensis]|uniref:Reverse transcriptase RNase H-like domain-containing protein n=1 Tax=Trichonephila inaurata madagascariensis TaxID=2747483 RepID=A0A8X6MI18_9ARAC|nr:hypothetical protein TNIN_167811 [Trichonephila inaurata madagascariensis]
MDMALGHQMEIQKKVEKALIPPKQQSRKNYSTTERESLAIIWGYKPQIFPCLLEKGFFTTVTDHLLLRLMGLKDLSGSWKGALRFKVSILLK